MNKDVWLIDLINEKIIFKDGTTVSFKPKDLPKEEMGVLEELEMYMNEVNKEK